MQYNDDDNDSHPNLAKLVQINTTSFAKVSPAVENDVGCGTTNGRPNIHCKKNHQFPGTFVLEKVSIRIIQDSLEY